MMAKIAGAAALMAGLALAGGAGAQGFSEGGAAGVAALRGTTASPGYGYGGSVGGAPGVGAPGVGAADGPAAVMTGLAAPRRRMAPTEVDFAPRARRPGAPGAPF